MEGDPTLVLPAQVAGVLPAQVAGVLPAQVAGVLPAQVAALADRLVDRLRSYGPCAVAFSAGVDSTVVAKAACLAHGDQTIAVTGVGPAVAAAELEDARRLAQLIGIRHVEVATDEANQPGYVRNATDRCFHCKTELYTHVVRVATQHGVQTLCNGANLDDLGDHRPGMVAARDFEVRSPLLECGMNKEAVRQIAYFWGLPVWDKPAAPCLASRIAYGVEVTPERLRRVERAESYLRSLGLRDLRVRLHAGEVARVEAPIEAIGRLVSDAVRPGLVAELRGLGFAAVTIDLEGLQSGSQNRLVGITLSPTM